MKLFLILLIFIMGHPVTSKTKLRRFTASLPYANLKEVSPVGVLTIVLYAQRILGNSSGHIPFAPSSGVLMIFNNDRFATSACLLTCGWDGEE